MPPLKTIAFALVFVASPIQAAPVLPTFEPAARAVSTWRQEALDNLLLRTDLADQIRAGATPSLARCVKLNNYWCVKRAGWNGEIASDGEGHVAFASAREGAAVAALLLKRYYIDFDRKTAMAIVSHWAPAPCGTSVAGLSRAKMSAAHDPVSPAPTGLSQTLRARWLAGHRRGFANKISRKAPPPRRSVIADHIERGLPTPTIALGLNIPTRPMTLDALLRASPNAPPSRSMLGMPYKKVTSYPAPRLSLDSATRCGGDGIRIAAYAAKAASGIAASTDTDLGLFKADGTPTPNLALLMDNMAQVEIGPLGAKPSLIAAGIAAAFDPGRNTVKP